MIPARLISLLCMEFRSITAPERTDAVIITVENHQSSRVCLRGFYPAQATELTH